MKQLVSFCVSNSFFLIKEHSLHHIMLSLSKCNNLPESPSNQVSIPYDLVLNCVTYWVVNLPPNSYFTFCIFVLTFASFTISFQLSTQNQVQPSRSPPFLYVFHTIGMNRTKIMCVNKSYHTKH